MSDTDDTDDLLLIPPDQFVSDAEVIDTYTNGPYFTIVDSLITQVHKLQSKVNSIENFDLISSLNSTMERYNSSDDILKDGYFASTYSTPQKPRTRYRVHSQSPPKPVSKFTTGQFTPRKQILQEFDGYVNNPRKTSKVTKAISDDIVEINGKIINLTEIEDMLEEIEVQKRKTEMRLRDKEESLQRQYAWRMGDDVKTLPMSASGSSTFPPNSDELSKMSVGKLSGTKTNSISSTGGDKSSISSTDSSQMTTMHVPSVITTSNQLGFYENLTLKNANGQDELLDINNSVHLMSLRQLWGRKEISTDGLKEKLEEEKLRRQHCEELIQELQTRSLEMQERLAVAVQVDKAKDKALLKFNDSWDKVTAHLKSITEDNTKLEVEVQDLHLKHEQTLEECSKKLKHYETEASKALSLAHANHEKLSTYRTQNSELQENLETVSNKLQQLEETYDNELKKSKQLNEIIVAKEIELNESKSVLTDSRNEVANSKQAIELCQAEFANMKRQYTNLELLLTEKQVTIKELETKMKHLQADNENLQILHSDTQKELAGMVQTMDKTKCELRDFYQQQVELLVQDKLKEFQMQLDKAETCLQEEIKKRELSIAKTAATHIQQITEKHNLEISLLEEKQKEEIKFYQMQIQQAQQHIDNQQMKMKHFQERRTNLAQQLHKVMEVQWLEALKIINNTKSPFNSTPIAIDNTIDQLRSLRTKSHNNLEEVLSDRADDADKQQGVAFNNYNQQLHETPVSSKGHHKTTNDLQKYVQLLLEKPSTSAAQIEVDQLKDATNLSKSSEELEVKSTQSQAHSRRFMKPPWK